MSSSSTFPLNALAVEVAKIVKVLVEGRGATLSILAFDAVAIGAIFWEAVRVAWPVDMSLLVEINEDVEIGELEMVVDVEFWAAKAVWKAGLIELLEDTTLSLSAVPFHRT